MKNAPVITSHKDWQDLIGIQYALTGGAKSGLTCYGLVREVYQLLNIQLPERQETSADGAAVAEGAGNDWTQLDEPIPYAVALIRAEGNVSAFHLAIVTPELTLLHSIPRKGVIVSPIRAYKDRVVGFYQHTPGCGQPLPLAEGDVGRILGTIAIIALAIAVPELAGMGMFGYSSAAGAVAMGGFAGAMASAVVMIGGTMILNAIAPIKPDQAANTSPVGNSTTYGWNGVTNNFQQGGSAAIVFGRILVGGQIISEKTWYDGKNEEYLDTLLCPCVGRITRFTGLLVNDTDISLYKNTAAVFRPGDDQQTAIDMFNRVYTQYSSASKIPYDASTTDPVNPVQFTTKSPLSGIRLSFSAPNGIYELSSATPIPHDVTFQIQYRPIGGAWSNLPTVDPTYGTDHVFIYRESGVFSGASNPRTLTDLQAMFAERIITGQQFILTVAGTKYYCTQSGVAGPVLSFNAFTDEGRTTPLSGTITNGPYDITDDTVKRYSGTVDVPNPNGELGSYYVTVTPPIAFETVSAVGAASCTLTLKSDTSTWARVQVWYQREFWGSFGTEWTLYDTYTAGYEPTTQYDSMTDSYIGVPSPVFGSASWDISIAGITYNFSGATYTSSKIRIAVVLSNSDISMTTDNFTIDTISADTSSPDGIFTLSGDASSPTHLVTKQIELSLPESNYDFRIWRTTIDRTDITWQDDVYLNGYAEILDRSLAYPGHALVGVRAMATDRLYGGRPKVTSIATGEPLTVPAIALQYNTTVDSDTGTVTDYTSVNGVIVTGMRKVLVNAVLPTPDRTYYWLVRMDSSGFAQPDRMLTKHFVRVQTWEILGSQTYVYLQDAESIPDATSIMLFSENADPYISRHTAWAVTKMLLHGSHGRITENSIDWDMFAEWDAWNIQIKTATSQPRHLYDAAIDYNTDLWSLAMSAARTARGNLIKRGGLYSVWIDRAATQVQLFGEGNSNNISINPIPRSDRANVLTTSFLDQTNNFEQKDISIEDVQGSEHPVVKNIPTQVGVVRESQVDDLLNYMLAQNRYVGSAVSLDAGIDSIEVTIGDVFMLASQSKDFAQSGRIQTVHKASVVLDQSFTPEAGVVYQLTIWGLDGTLFEWTGELGSEPITTIATTVPYVDHYEYPYVLCKSTEERMKYRCVGMRRAGDTMHATIAGIEYRDECYIND